MGTWGMGVFDDDSALDFLGELTEVKDPLSLMNHSFVSAAASKYLEYDSAQSVLVSAAAIDTLLNGTKHGDDLEELDAWAQRNRNLNVTSLKSLAVAAIRRVLSEGSELRELWSENAKDYPTWRGGLESLAARLDS
ncbi:MAG TPA: DUF4259 domain-containing protein [Steroidobacteraceae bacterium]|jgi:hypothetical protein|nr:DUF4259 domain-containing protein [Steroidobacteraceae bacterium]